MNDTINLRKHRKNKSRAEKETTAAANRQAFGLSKSERQSQKDSKARSARFLDNHKRDGINS